MNDSTEHFVTLFDRSFLPYGMVLADSLERVCPNHHLWIVAMDDAVVGDLACLGRKNCTVIPVGDLETPAHLEKKSGRSKGEWCWTMTPFTFRAVKDRCPSAKRITYLDADLCFYQSPLVLLKDLEIHRKSVLITEHAYDPEWDLSQNSGRFCVQFLTVCDDPKAWEVIRWWEERCLEWCFARVEPDRFGDQKYLDVWPKQFPDTVHIHSQPELTQGPWNRRQFQSTQPVFYHFHGVRTHFDRDWNVVAAPYLVDSGAARIYRTYIDQLQTWRNRLATMGVSFSDLPPASLRTRCHGVLCRFLLGRHSRFRHMLARPIISKDT